MLFVFLSSNNLLSFEYLLNTQQISGSVQLDSYYYLNDSVIGAIVPNERLLSNGYFYLNYQIANFDIALRYESYQNPILGFDNRYKGSGIAFRSINYKGSFFSASVGNFYEQFGSGMIFRSYEERNLGIDNSIDGFKVELYPTEGIIVKGLIGKQRKFWSLSQSIIRGGDINIELGQLFPNVFKQWNLILGSSVVSRYQPDLESFYRLPGNVLAFSNRLELVASSFSLFIENGHKFNDPTTRNKYSYNPGNGLNLNFSYFLEGFSLFLNLHRYDNFEFRTEREAKGLELLLNYLPPVTKQHIFSLPSRYPHSTQGNGEIGIQTEVTYTIPAQSFFNDKYETNLTIGFSRINSLDTNQIDEFTYKANFPGFGNVIYYQDINFDLRKKFSDDFECEFSAIHLIYNKDVLRNEGSPLYGKVKSFTLALETNYQINKSNSLRLEFQNMWAKNDSAITKDDTENGNWLAFLAEYSIAPSWYFSLLDQYNYGNQNEEFRIHYLKFFLTYFKDQTRISLAFGKDPGGILCVGGICRALPTSFGFSLSITSSF
ncbi:MAG: DUF6029 family protein [Candidatus Kapaibacteriales bacterium]